MNRLLTLFTRNKREFNLKESHEKKRIGNGVSAVFNKLAKAFMLPIALLPVAGILLGVGGTITGHASNHGLVVFGNVLQTVGGIPFDNLSVLFCISVAIAFTDDAGAAGLTALVAFLVFNAFIYAFISTNSTTSYDYVISGIDTFEKKSSITISLNQNLGDNLSKLSNLLKFIADNGYKDYVANWTDLHLDAVNKVSTITGYNLWFWQDNISINPKLMGNVLGIQTLNTGVFGGIAVGAVVAYLYNRLHKVQLPSVLSFFSGTRLVPIVAFFAIMLLSCFFILIWPGIGTGLNKFGELSGKLPAGLDSFIEGVICRALIPFGLHHVFYAPLWWSGAGGSLIDFQGKIIIDHAIELLGNSNQALVNKLNALDNSANAKELLEQIKKIVAVDDYSRLVNWFDAIKPATWQAQGDQTAFIAVVNDGTLKIQDVWQAGLHLGRFQTGGFPLFLFGLPAVCLAMWLNVPKENRRKILGIYASAAMTSMLVGVTEPVEFTFLFIAPWLYYGIYVPAAGICWMAMNLLHVKICVTFSQGFLDYIIYGIIPFTNNNDTKFWIVLIFGVVIAIVLFLIFYYVMKWKNIEVPGKVMNNDSVVKLFNKKDYQAKGNANQLLASEIIAGYGGCPNIVSVDACATRLRVIVNDNTLVDRDKLKLTGAIGVIVKQNSVQAIYGPKADVIKNYVKEEWECMKKEKKLETNEEKTNA